MKSKLTQLVADGTQALENTVWTVVSLAFWFIFYRTVVVEDWSTQFPNVYMNLNMKRLGC